MASANEKRAKELGISLKEYKASSEYKSKKAYKKQKEEATKKIKKYYKKKEETVKKNAKTDINRLKEDLNNIYKDAGIYKTRALEDYERNIENIEENKDLDVDNLKEYVEVNKGRTQEDLDVALAKETRRYSLEYDKINQDLAERGLTFSERTDEKVAKETSEIQKTDLNREATRSFQDIARYEAAKTRELELKYGQQTEEATVNKSRSLEDITRDMERQVQKNQRSSQDIMSNLEENLSELSYSKDTDVATTGQLFDQQYALERNNERLFNFQG